MFLRINPYPESGLESWTLSYVTLVVLIRQ